MKNQKELWRVILAVSLTVVGVLHFVSWDQFVRIVPPQLPYPKELVYISGFFEILGGIGLLVPPVSRAAAWGLIALFIAVFPANINMAVNNIPIDGIPQNQLLYWLRLPFQAVFIYWAWLYTQPDEDRPRASIIPYGTEDAK
ncbi:MULTISPECIES: DoxX family protein [Kamptonema]|uniref:DoxX family protein n=1 Tax=Kamptonema TaxID=1501433 RepID=UPI0001DAC450|nr:MULTISPECIES: DoxX family protein [Kamptonema]CBN57307.1 Membrane protein-like protein [Kamptonema sp. PCC 6506]